MISLTAENKFALDGVNVVPPLPPPVAFTAIVFALSDSVNVVLAPGIKMAFTALYIFAWDGVKEPPPPEAVELMAIVLAESLVVTVVFVPPTNILLMDVYKFDRVGLNPGIVIVLVVPVPDAVTLEPLKLITDAAVLNEEL